MTDDQHAPAELYGPLYHLTVAGWLLVVGAATSASVTGLSRGVADPDVL